MRAILIDPIKQSVEPYTINHHLSSLQRAVGGIIAFGTELKTGDVLYIGDEGLLKPNPSFFALRGRAFAGRGLLVGPERGEFPIDVVSTVDDIKKLMSFDVNVDLDRLLTVKSTTFNSPAEFFDYLRAQRAADRQ